MNKKTSKKLKAIIGDIDNPIMRRVYRRLKKQYNKVPEDSRSLFIEMTKETLNAEK
jgi:hypothetical protein